MIKRELLIKLNTSAKKFPIVSVIGPRQSGKTTLVKMAFPYKPYVSLEDTDIREYATSDPRGFLSDYPKGAILDEVQRVPKLFSYLQTAVDKADRPGLFILTGSQHFLLHENISQTLAGRSAIFTLLPFSLAELKDTPFRYNDYEDYIFRGFYPRIYDKRLNPSEWYLNYIQTYVERDLRLIKNIDDLGTFQTFLKMCAARIGQLLNLSSLANDCGITHNTAKSWISILELSFIVFLLRPHYKNFNKRLVKMPKLYFYDPGLASSLLGIENKRQVANHYLKGGLFETFVISELLKHRYNEGLEMNHYFWRDKVGHEIDCIIEKGSRLIPIEIKSGKTPSAEYLKDLNYWNKLAKNRPKNSYVIYGGDITQRRSEGTILSWKNIGDAPS
ncbi:MAG: ATP-binding protein [Candidatus Omnitrophica bacterium]|nr:ATP-binding protein [Candidatus Omnitrophota bacterium]